MKNDKLMQILAIIVSVLVIAYFGFNMISNAGNGYQTSTVYISTISDTVDTEMFIIRNEEIITSNESGVVVSLADNGEKVSNGSDIAAVFSDETSAENYSMSLSLCDKLNTYKKIDGQVKLANIDLDKLTNETDSVFADILDAVYYNDFSSLSDDELSFSEKLSRKNISLGYDIDCSEKISALEKEISSLQSVSPLKVIKTENSGYYVSRPDGYEDVIPFDSVENLTEKQLTDAFSAEKKEISKNAIGKVIVGFEWYVACLLPSEKLADVETGANMKILFSDSDEEAVTAKLYKKQLCDDKCLTVFKCSFMNESLSGIRKTTGKIILSTHTGLKIRKDAVRFNAEGDEGVYILEGNVIKFNKISELYSDDKFVIADPDKTGSGWLAQYDTVMVSGKELANGKVIR